MQFINEAVTGSKYVGGGTTYRGLPSSYFDATGMYHDRNYSKYKHWATAYLKYNNADEKMLKDMEKAYGTKGARQFIARFGAIFLWNAKKWVAPRASRDEEDYADIEMDEEVDINKSYDDIMPRKKAKVGHRKKRRISYLRDEIDESKYGPPPDMATVNKNVMQQGMIDDWNWRQVKGSKDLKQAQLNTRKRNREHHGSPNSHGLSAHKRDYRRIIDRDIGAGDLVQIDKNVGEEMSSREVIRTGRSKKSRRKLIKKKVKKLRKTKPTKKNIRKNLKADIGQAKRIRSLEKQLLPMITRAEYRNHDSIAIATVVNGALYTFIQDLTYATIQYIWSNLKFYDIKIPGTLLTVDVDASVAFDKKIAMQSYTEYIYRNNELGPISMEFNRVKLCRGSGQAYSLFLANINSVSIEQSVSATGFIVDQDPRFRITDFKKEINENFTIGKTLRIKLEPGQTFVYKCKKPWMMPHVSAQQTAGVYAKYIDGYCLRMLGGVAHDYTTETNVGYARGKVDCIIKQFIKIRYNGGLAVKYYIPGTGTMDSMAGGPMVVDMDGPVEVKSYH